MCTWLKEAEQQLLKTTKSTRRRWAVETRMLLWTRHLIWIFSTSTIKREMISILGHNIKSSRLQRSNSRNNRPLQAIRHKVNKSKCKKLKELASSQGIPFRISWSFPRAIFPLADQKEVTSLSTWPTTRAASCAGSHSLISKKPFRSKYSAAMCNARAVWRAQFLITSSNASYATSNSNAKSIKRTAISSSQANTAASKTSQAQSRLSTVS